MKRAAYLVATLALFALAGCSRDEAKEFPAALPYKVVHAERLDGNRGSFTIALNELNPSPEQKAHTVVKAARVLMGENKYTAAEVWITCAADVPASLGSSALAVARFGMYFKPGWDVLVSEANPGPEQIRLLQAEQRDRATGRGIPAEKFHAMLRAELGLSNSVVYPTLNYLAVSVTEEK